MNRLGDSYKKYLDDNTSLEFSIVIALFGAIPFFLLLLVMLFTICKRKIEDYYLRWSIGVLIAAMALRIAFSFIAFILMTYMSINNMDWRNFMLKFQVFDFSIPYFAYQIVFISLLFSVYTFYRNLRNTLYPQLAASDAQSVIIEPPHVRNGEDLRSNYFFLNALINIFLWTFVIVCIIGQQKVDEDEEGEESFFNRTQKAVLWICEIGNYLISAGVLLRSYITLYLLLKLKKSTPALDIKQHYELVERLRDRMKIIRWGLAGFIAIQTASFLMYTCQRTIHLFNDKYVFYTNPTIQIVQLSLELIFCLSVISTICIAQNKRFSENSQAPGDVKPPQVNSKQQPVQNDDKQDQKVSSLQKAAQNDEINVAASGNFLSSQSSFDRSNSLSLQSSVLKNSLIAQHKGTQPPPMKYTNLKQPLMMRQETEDGDQIDFRSIKHQEAMKNRPPQKLMSSFQDSSSKEDPFE